MNSSNNIDLPWHCRSEGPWWKRLRMFFFGLTAREQAENFASFSVMRQQAFEEMMREEAEDEEIILALNWPTEPVKTKDSAGRSSGPAGDF